MNLKNMTREEIETLSYADLAYIILEENGKAMNTPTIFKKICELLEYSDEEYSSKIGDFYTSLTTDKRFILLDSAEWDLRDNHSVKIVMEDDEEDEALEEEETDEENDDVEEEEDIDSSIDDDDLVDDDDDMDDLEIVEDEEELDEN